MHTMRLVDSEVHCFLNMLTHPVCIRTVASSGGIVFLHFPVTPNTCMDAMRYYICTHMHEVEEPKGLKQSQYCGYMKSLNAFVVMVEYALDDTPLTTRMILRTNYQ